MEMPSLPELNGSIYALIGTLFGGVAVKIVEGFFSSRKSREELRDKRDDREEDMEEKLRSELWLQAKELRHDLDKLAGDLDVWKDKYYQGLGKNTELMAELRIITDRNEKLVIELKEISERNYTLSQEIEQLRQDIHRWETQYRDVSKENQRLLEVNRQMMSELQTWRREMEDSRAESDVKDA